MPFESAVRDGSAAGFELIETLRWEPAHGFVRLDRHLARLAASARELGFVFDAGGIEAALAAAAKGDAPLRLRLALEWNGKAAVTAQPFAPLPAGTVWKIRIAEIRLDAGGPLLRHKTTRRAIYDAARAEFSRDEADEVILLNESGQVCEGTITNVFIEERPGMFVTPAISCGLLPGVLRGEMLESGKAKEAPLTEGDLHSAKAIFVGNSLRGLIRAKLMGRVGR